MKDFNTIIKAYEKIDFSAKQAALATVVRVQGSSYRSPGARMLITSDGKWVGSISGGCLEGDALRKARKVMAENKPTTVTYDTREESNQNLGIGLGCHGLIEVLIEPIDPQDEGNAINVFKEFVDYNEPIAVATVFESSSHTGEKFLITERGDIKTKFSSPSLSELVLADLSEVFFNRKSMAREYSHDEGLSSVFIELIQPSVHLLIFGGGFDARPVTALAKSLGWKASVTDECAAHIAPIFFPAADNLTLCHRQFIEKNFEISAYTACVLMSHNYEYDRDVLKHVLKTKTPYIGILGPRKRFDKMLDEYSRTNFEITSEDFLRIHSPIGLDIGAEAPDEIAVSIVAEIQSIFSKRAGGSLKYREGPIHQRLVDSGTVPKQAYFNSN